MAGARRVSSSTEDVLSRHETRLARLERKGYGFAVPEPVDTSVETYAQADPPEEPIQLGSLWIDTNNYNTMYRWDGSAWVPVIDPLVDRVRDEAASDLVSWQDVEAVSDGLVTTYVASAPPTGGSYQVGDLWINSSNNQLFRRTGGAWVSLSDTTLGASYLRPQNALSYADGRVRTFWANSEPVATGFGDLWVQVSVTPNVLYRWNNFDWVRVIDWDVVQVNEALDTKTTTFKQPNPPPTALAKGDIWYNESEGNTQYRAAAKGASTVATGAWEPVILSGEAVDTAPTAPPAESPAIKKVTGMPNGFVIETQGVETSTIIEYHIRPQPSPVTAFVPTPGDPATLVASTSSTVVTTTSHPSGPYVVSTVDSTGQPTPYPYQVAVIATNGVPPAPSSSAAVTAYLDTTATMDLILQRLIAGFVLAGKITVGKVTISAINLTQGEDYDPVGGIKIETVSGDIIFPANGDPAEFAGKVIARELTVEDKGVLQGTTSLVGKMVVASNVSNPAQAPVLTTSTPSTQVGWPGAVGSANNAGMCEFSSTEWAMIDAPNTTNPTYILRRVNKTTGSLNGTVGGGTLPSGYFYRSVIRTIAGDYIFLARSTQAGGGIWYLRRFNSSLVFQNAVSIGEHGSRFGYASPMIALAPEGTLSAVENVLLAWIDPSDFKPQWQVSGTGSGNLGTLYLSGALPSASFGQTRSVGALWWGDAGAGYNTFHLGVADYGAVYAWKIDSGSFVRDAPQDFSRPADATVAQLTYDSTTQALTVLGQDRLLYPLSRFHVAIKAVAKHSWYDAQGTPRETVTSPASAMLTVPPRSWLSVTTSAPPNATDSADDRANQVRHYIASTLATVAGTPSSFKLRRTIPFGGPWKSEYNLIPTSGGTGIGTKDPETVNGFIGFSPLGALESANQISSAPAWYLQGDGSGRAGAHEWNSLGVETTLATPDYLVAAQSYAGSGSAGALGLGTLALPTLRRHVTLHIVLEFTQTAATTVGVVIGHDDSTKDRLVGNAVYRVPTYASAAQQILNFMYPVKAGVAKNVVLSMSSPAAMTGVRALIWLS